MLLLSRTQALCHLLTHCCRCRCLYDPVPPCKQELLGYYLGKGRRPVRFVAFLISFYWFGVCVAQILASATNYYAIDKTYNLR